MRRDLCECVITARNGIKIPDLECPSCGGTGKQRMVAVGGIDIEALREALRNAVIFDGRDNLRHEVGRAAKTSAALKELARAVLAALEGETDA